MYYLVRIKSELEIKHLVKANIVSTPNDFKLCGTVTLVRKVYEEWFADRLERVWHEKELEFFSTKLSKVLYE